MKITDVEVIVLESPSLYAAPSGAEEAHGIRHLCLVKVSTDEGISGYSRCGGLTTAKRIADYAELRNISVCPHAWLSDLLSATSLHLNAYLKESLFLEFNVSAGPLVRELCQNPMELKDGYLDVPQGPGLGVEVNEQTIARYRVA
ncbi:MAG: hypothetical protein HY682_08030 [Chloroflexi bacterium]|nr:hypothetical protein [Chloroflexota bacterium]